MLDTAPLSLKVTFLEKVSFEIPQEKVKENFSRISEGRFALIDPSTLDFVLTLGHKKDMPNDWKCELTVSTKHDVDLPFKFSITMSGLMTVHQQWEGIPNLESVVSNTAPSLVYGAIREFIMSLSSRTLFQTIVLPTVRFRGRKLELKPGKSVSQINMGPQALPTKKAGKIDRKKHAKVKRPSRAKLP